MAEIVDLIGETGELMRQVCLGLLILLMGTPVCDAAGAPKKPGIKIPENFCRPGQEILEATTGCLDNRLFVDEADACLDRLEAEADRVSKGMKAGFSKDATAAQTGKFSSSSEDYQYAALTFDDLAKLTDQVMDEIDSYSDYVNLPEDSLNDELTGGDMDAYAEKHPCYSETQDSIQSVMEDLGDMKKEFLEGKTKSEAAAASADGRRSNLDVNQSGSVPGGAHNLKSAGQSGPAVVPGGTPKSGSSDITGVKQDQQKAQQK